MNSQVGWSINRFKYTVNPKLCNHVFSFKLSNRRSKLGNEIPRRQIILNGTENTFESKLMKRLSDEVYVLQYSVRSHN